MNSKVKVLILILLFSFLSDAGASSFQSIQPVDSVKEFDDARWKDLSMLDLSQKQDVITTLRFNEKTVWPESSKTFAAKLLKDAMNPGLGVRKLHEQGITGKGVNVAIIDQPLYLDHPEFIGKTVEYYDTGCGSKSSMHGPAVTSLLVGTNCGTAPDARVYYAAAPSWKKDSSYYAKALDWILEQNAKLSSLEKIRVVSVSAAPSGTGSPFDKNNAMWDKACARAEAAGILVLDCTNKGFIGACWYDADDPENVSKCRPGFRGQGGWRRHGYVLAPTCPRTTAEQYDPNEFSYQYCGTGGLSWAIPYCAGVLALGWQINPQLTGEQIKEILFQSAYQRKSGAKIINPQNFIRFVKDPNLIEITKQKRQEIEDASSNVSQIPVGKWQSVDYIHGIDSFVPGEKQWQGEFYLKSLTFYKNGRTSKAWVWKKGYLLHQGDKTKSKYLIKEIEDSTYMFLEWIPDGKEAYYVLEKR